MCEKVMERIPTLTAEERVQLRHNCQRAIARSPDGLVVQEARRVLDKLDKVEQREARLLARLPVSRRIEYAFRRLPASQHERHAIQSLLQQATTPPVSVVHDDGRPSWHRHIDEMCRTRHHLLRLADQRRHEEQASPEPQSWTSPLMEIDADKGTLRLRPEAIVAFASLGYVDAPAA